MRQIVLHEFGPTYSLESHNSFVARFLLFTSYGQTSVRHPIQFVTRLALMGFSTTIVLRVLLHFIACF